MNGWPQTQLLTLTNTHLLLQQLIRLTKQTKRPVSHSVHASEDLPAKPLKALFKRLHGELAISGSYEHFRAN